MKTFCMYPLTKFNVTNSGKEIKPLGYLLNKKMTPLFDANSDDFVASSNIFSLTHSGLFSVDFISYYLVVSATLHILLYPIINSN